MRLRPKIPIFLICLAVVLGGGTLAIWLALPAVERWGVAFHQKSVTRSLSKWALEHGVVTNDATAVAAADMVGYMSTYYVPGPGYRASPDVEAALEAQRRDSVAHVVEALERYTGLDHGTNAQRWAEWAEQQERRTDVQTNSEQRGVSNAVQQSRSGTNLVPPTRL